MFFRSVLRIDFILALPVWLALPLPLASYTSGAQRDPVASSCTLYASPSGDDKNSGNTATDPKTLSGAASLTKPGSVVCLLSGTYSLNASFEPPRSGSSSAWIVFKNRGDGPVNLVWTGAADAQPMIRIQGGKFPSGPAYLEFRGLRLDGRGKALDGFYSREPIGRSGTIQEIQGSNRLCNETLVRRSNQCKAAQQQRSG